MADVMTNIPIPNSRYSPEIRQQLEFLGAENIARNFHGFAKFDHSMSRIRYNMSRATDDQLMKAANASQQELQQLASEPGEFNPFRYH
jgi:hypothetical protein